MCEWPGWHAPTEWVDNDGFMFTSTCAHCKRPLMMDSIGNWFSVQRGPVKKGTDLPPITQQPIIHVDGTPDDGYVLRILRAYRENGNCVYEVSPPSVLWDMMNKHQRQRAELLDAAIAKLAKKGAEDEEG